MLPQALTTLITEFSCHWEVWEMAGKLVPSPNRSIRRWPREATRSQLLPTHTECGKLNLRLKKGLPTYIRNTKQLPLPPAIHTPEKTFTPHRTFTPHSRSQNDGGWLPSVTMYQTGNLVAAASKHLARPLAMSCFPERTITENPLLTGDFGCIILP